MTTAKVELSGVSKRYGAVTAVDRVDLSIGRGEFLTLLGPSGCGKTTTLMMIAGFEQPSGGTILVDGTDVTGQPPFERDVNTVFQNYALFPHMRVYDNVAFGLRAKKVPEPEIRAQVAKALEMVQLGGYAARWPRQLSGGQQQRVALARAIVNNPQVLLLDEPLGALDLKLRKEMQVELKHIQQKLGITFVYVTHDQEEALVMSDRIVVMKAGRIEQVDTPAQIYERPRTRFVADFIGETNLLEARLAGGAGAGATVEFEGRQFPVDLPGAVPAGAPVWISIRPERIRLAGDAEAGATVLPVQAAERIYVGATVKLICRTAAGTGLVVSGPAGSALEAVRVGDPLRVAWDSRHCVAMTS